MNFRFWTDPVVAILAGVAQRFLKRRLHNLGGHERGIQTHRPRRGRQEVGGEKIQAEYEL